MLEKIFKAYDVRATYPSPLNEDAAWKVGSASAPFLKGKRNEGVRQPEIVIVGRDMRPHSPSLADALIEGISSTGMNVIDIGMVDTAMTYFATFTRGDQVMTEHFIRVLSPRGYVMFFTTGRFEDVKTIMPQLKQAASTVKGP